ncbi:helix-turn-helix domain-containing protein [Clostridium sp. SYSU_GA19001]|uniref:helix-turn-helix domain-containing protein n=1 Tax=Clostridium caldaquaticum TaxID=2940653 RepID=UPI002076E7BC|nr:helix-turn-helix transcriptional regulator [Clostridium caldaquaticum]MCM8710496.1 helix-turn-helix domain-containing protein [Clostridium caldaquaticum]
MFDIGSRIKELRNINNITSSELASKIGISQPQLSRIENNVNTATFDTIFKLCNIFDISLTEFFNDNTNNLIPSHFKDFIEQNKDLTPEQLELLSKFIKSIK